MTSDVTVRVPAEAFKALGKWILLAAGAAVSSGTGLLVVQHATPAAPPSASDGERRDLAVSVESLRLEVRVVRLAVDSARVASDSSAARLARAEKLLVALAADQRARQAASPALRPAPVPASLRLEDALYTSAIGADQ